jgi:hypothetical protein
MSTLPKAPHGYEWRLKRGHASCFDKFQLVKPRGLLPAKVYHSVYADFLEYYPLSTSRVIQSKIRNLAVIDNG